VDFGRIKDLDFQKGVKLLFFACSSRTEAAVPIELSGMTRVTVLLMLILCLRLYP
jgi:hypothetical protein